MFTVNCNRNQSIYLPQYMYVCIYLSNSIAESPLRIEIETQTRNSPLAIPNHFSFMNQIQNICIAMSVNQSVNQSTNQSIKLSQPKVSQISQLYIYISVSISISISINQSAQYISSFTSYSRRILVVFFILSFSLSIYTI